MLLRVIVSESEIRRLSIEDIPSSVEELYQVLRTNLALRGGFILQFEDPDFKNQLCNLTDIKDLPVDRATLKVLFTADDSSDSTLDTGSLSSPRQSPENMEVKRKIMEAEMQKKDPNHQLLEDLMVATFSQRRKDIVGDQPHITELISRWPALFHERQAHADILDDAMKGMQVGLLIACEGSEQGAIPHEVFDVAVVVEETIVLHNIKDLTVGFAMLMGVIYCINLKYPNDMKYSFEFLQRVVMKISPDHASAQ
ncbi:unnamed protein product, partial [Menidia menidia]